MPLAFNPFAPRGASVYEGGSMRPMPRGATRHLAQHRRATRRVGAVSLVVALFATLFTASFGSAGSANAVGPGANPAKAAGLIQTNTVEGAENPASPKLVVAPQEPLLAVGAQEYVFEVLVRNPLTEELPGGTLSLQLVNERIESADALAELKSGKIADGSGSGSVDATPLVEAEVQPTGAEGEQSFTVSVARADLPLDAVSAAGVYGVQAELRLDAVADTAEQTPAGDTSSPNAPTSLTTTTTTVWRGQSFGKRLPLTLVVPMVLPDDVRSMPTRADLGDAATRLDELLTAAEKWQATLAIDPRIIAGIRAYGNAAPEPARDLLTRLEQTSLPMFLLQFADADPAVQAALGFDELMQPVGLSFLTRLGSFEAPPLNGSDNDTSGNNADGTGPNDGNGSGSDQAQQTPDPEGDAASDPQAPALDKLLDWPQAQPAAWPANGQVDAKTMALLRGSGITQLVLDSDNVSGAGTARAQVAGFDTLVTSASLDDSAAVAIGGETETERAGGLAVLAANLAFGAQPALDSADKERNTESPAMVLALDRGAVADAEAPAQLMQSLNKFDWVQPLAASDLSLSSGKLQPGQGSALRTKLLTETLERSGEIDELSPLLEQPGYLVQYQRTRLLNALATRYASPSVDFSTFNRATHARDKKLLAGVKVVPSENTQLVGTPSNVPVLIRNSLPFDALITLRASPTSAAVAVTEMRFPDERVTADSNATVLVPVRTRVSSGVSGLLVQVADSRDDTVYASSMLHLTIRTSFETILLITLGALSVLLLGLGVWRSILRRRTARLSELSPPSEPALPAEHPGNRSSQE